MKFFDVKHPMFNPLWVRIIVTAICALWAMLEFGSGNPFWGILFAAAAAFCLWKFFINFEEYTDNDSKDESGKR